MSALPPPSAADAAVLQAEHSLAQLHEQAEALRAVLIRLAQEVVEAQSLAPAPATQVLVEANEHLAEAALKSRAEAAAASRDRDELQRVAQLDALTQLPLRPLLLDRFSQAIGAAHRRHTQLALLFLDLDDFKQINDRLGHAVGDQVLQQVAQRLQASVRAMDTVSRHGGDEFLVLLAEVNQAQDAGAIAIKLIAAVAEPIRIGARPPLRLGVSIGISVFPEDGEDAVALIERADAAMYAAKKGGTGRHAFHGAAPSLAPAPAPPPGGPDPARELERALQGHHTQLREANEQLLLAALGARALQAAAEQAQQRQAAFVAAVAQELRNPLAPIRIATAMLGRPGVDEALMPRVEALVAQQLAQMSRLVGDLLETRPGGGSPPALARQLIDLGGVIERSIAVYRPLMTARSQHFTVERPPGPLWVNGDAERLEQIVGNLLDNATKHTHDGGHITLAVRHAPDDLTLSLSVSDDGIGIARGTLPILFEPFVQDPQAIGFHGIGLGIGLTVVRSLVEAHGGGITAHSAGSGLGSRFVVTLPVVAGNGAPPVPGSDSGGNARR